jgi:hypothetical protein
MKLYKSIIKTAETIKDRSQMSKGDILFYSVYERINDFIHTVVLNILKSKKASITLLIILSLIFLVIVYFIAHYVQQRTNTRKTTPRNVYMKEEKYACNTLLLEVLIDTSKVNTSGKLELKIDVLDRNTKI